MVRPSSSVAMQRSTNPSTLASVRPISMRTPLRANVPSMIAEARGSK